MSDDNNNIFDEEDTQTVDTQTTDSDTTDANTATGTEEHSDAQGEYQQNPYGYNQQQNTYGQYQQDPYGQYAQQNPYGQYQQQGAKGKKIGQGFGIASLVLGIIALVTFCTCVNLILAVIAIVFGIIQLVKYEKKGMAIGGISTAGMSILLFFICWGMLFSNDKFTEMIQKEIYIEEMPNSDEIEDWEKLIEEYSNGNYSIDIEGTDEDGDYKVQVTPNENGEPEVHIDENGDTL